MADMVVVGATLEGERAQWSLGQLLPAPFDREAP
jgi:hypothetical protein